MQAEGQMPTRQKGRRPNAAMLYNGPYAWAVLDSRPLALLKLFDISMAILKHKTSFD